MNPDTRLAVMEQLYLDERMTLDEIGSVFSISRERVRQVLSRSPKYNTYRSTRPPINRANAELLSRLDDEFGLHQKIWDATFGQILKGTHWLWDGAVATATGLPIIPSSYVAREFPSAGRYAHRVIWVMVNGALPEEMVLRRKDSCTIGKMCVNPDCFFPSYDRWGHHD